MGKMLKGCLSIVGAIVVIAIIIGIIVAATGGGGDSSSRDQNGEGSSNGGDGAEQETYSMGEEVALGNVTYTIEEISTDDTVGPSALEETAQDTFVILDITFTNNGNEAVNVSSGYLQLQQGDNTYEADEIVSATANQNEDGTIDSALFNEQVNPGSTVEGSVVFDVTSEVAESDDLQVQVQEGALGSNAAVVELDN